MLPSHWLPAQVWELPYSLHSLSWQKWLSFCTNWLPQFVRLLPYVILTELKIKHIMLSLLTTRQLLKQAKTNSGWDKPGQILRPCTVRSIQNLMPSTNGKKKRHIYCVTFVSLSWKMLNIYIFVVLSLFFLDIHFPADIRNVSQPYYELALGDLKCTNSCTY